MILLNSKKQTKERNLYMLSKRKEEKKLIREKEKENENQHRQKRTP